MQKPLASIKKAAAKRKPTPLKEFSKFENLPPELILLIFEQLSPQSALALLHTAKSFWAFKTSKPIQNKKIDIPNIKFLAVYQSLCEVKTPWHIVDIPFEKNKNIHILARLFGLINNQPTQEQKIIHLRAATSTSYFVQKLLNDYLPHGEDFTHKASLSIEIGTVLFILLLKHALDTYTPYIHRDRVPYQYKVTLYDIHLLIERLNNLPFELESTIINQTVEELRTSVTRFAEAVNKMDEKSKAAISYEETEKPPWDLKLEVILQQIKRYVKKYPSFEALHEKPLDTYSFTILDVDARSTRSKINVITEKVRTFWSLKPITARFQFSSSQERLLPHPH